MTAVNKITLNLFLRQPKGIDDQISKQINSNFEKKKRHNAIYRRKPKLLSCQPTTLDPIRDVADPHRVRCATTKVQHCNNRVGGLFCFSFFCAPC